MKRRIKVILSCSIVFALLLVLFLTGVPGTVSKGHVGLLFRLNRGKFDLAAAHTLQQGSSDGIRAPAGVKDIDLYGTHSGCVDFYMGGFGIVPSSTYWGVIYTEEDAPIGFQGLDVEYTWDGEGWYWQEPDGDNYSYVTKLDDHWYLYEMSF